MTITKSEIPDRVVLRPLDEAIRASLVARAQKRCVDSVPAGQSRPA